MAELVERPIPTLFGGVSRQPDSVRNDNQVEECNNALLSVVSGGFEKRPGTQWIDLLTNVSTGQDYFCHFINRSPTEQYVVLIEDGELRVYDAITGTEETINTNDMAYDIFNGVTGVNSTGIKSTYELRPDSSETTVDWSFVSTSAAHTWKIEGSADNAVWNDIATGKTGTSGSFSTTIGAVATGDHNYVRLTVTAAGGTATDFVTVRGSGKFRGYLYQNDPAREDWACLTVADYTLIVNRSVFASMRRSTGGTLTGTQQTFSDLPAATGSNNIQRVEGGEASNFTPYYVQDVATGVWRETTDPRDQFKVFNNLTLPHTLVRESNGTWSFGHGPWITKQVGDGDSVPVPPFIGEQIKDVTYFRGRLGIVAGESVFLGQANDFWNLWPLKAAEVLDTDPIDRAASTNDIALLQWARAFRKVLFLTARQSQFEMTSFEAFTPSTAQFDLATSYTASESVRPVTMGDVMYFPSEDNKNTVIYEYFYDDTSVSNTAVDVTRHVQGYIPTSVVVMASDNTSSTLFIMNSAERNIIYVYRAFFDGTEKLQSAWCKYVFGATEEAAFIHGFDVLDGFLVVVVERSDGLHLEQMPIEREEANATLGFAPLLDQRTTATASYNSGTNTSTWTVPYDHDDEAIIVVGPSFDDNGNTPTVAYPTGTTITATGDYSGAACWIGRPYTMEVQLSRPYVKENNTAIITGRYQLLDITFQHVDTGFYTVEVTPKQRDTDTYKFVGKIVGDALLIIDKPAIVERGQFRVPIQGRNEDTKVVVKNNSVYPSVITNAAWRAQFNEISRQE